MPYSTATHLPRGAPHILVQVAFDFDQQPYVDLRSIVAERTRRIVVWAGAGLSVPAGVPSWHQLREMLISALEGKAKTLQGADRVTHERYAENARNARSPWDAFKILKKGLGDTSYTATIRRALEIAQTAPVPQAYERIWELAPQGIINLNLDKLASRAFASVFAGARSNSEFSSRTVGSHTHLLSHPNTPFTYNAHGTEDDVRSWVFTTEDLNALLSTPAT